MPDLLTPAEESALARRARAGDRSARDELVVRNLGLAVKLARCYRHRGIDRDDILQIARLGLVRAADRFDPDRGHRFSTYAHEAIKRLFFRAFATDGGVIALPANVFRDGDQRAARKARRCIAESDIDSNNPALAGIIAARRQSCPVERAETVAAVCAALDRLPPREAEIVRRHAGIGCEPETHAAIAAGLGITPQYAWQIEARAIERLRRLLGPRLGEETGERP